jgi:uncharacterized protein with HEPN domain
LTWRRLLLYIRQDFSFLGVTGIEPLLTSSEPEETMQQNDRKYLSNMLDAAETAAGFVQSKTRNDLDDDRQLTLSLLKALEMVGEAAARVSTECQAGCQPIPWEKVIEVKHQVVQAYWDIDRDWIWQRVTEDLPRIVRALEELLSRENN